MRNRLTRKPFNFAFIIAASLLALLPLYVNVTGDNFYLDLANRLMILAIAAVSLNLILGHGGMISFGHAAYLGIGAYSVGIPAYYEIYDGLFQLCTAVLIAGAFALLTGAVKPSGKRIGVILSGGNISPERFVALMEQR